jgi:hypothetical protein
MTRRRIIKPLQTIDLATLDTVSGGRILPKSGVDPLMLQGMQELTKAVAAIGQTMEAKKQQSSSQMMQMMQQMMQRRG